MKLAHFNKQLARWIVPAVFVGSGNRGSGRRNQRKNKSIDAQTRSCVGNSQAIYAGDTTNYDYEYWSFEGVKAGGKVEVDYRNDNGRFPTKKIEEDGEWCTPGRRIDRKQVGLHFQELLERVSAGRDSQEFHTGTEILSVGVEAIHKAHSRRNGLTVGQRNADMRFLAAGQ